VEVVMMVRRKDDVRQKVHDRVDDAIDKMDELNERGQETWSQAKAKMHKMRDDADEYVQRNPERSVLLAAGAGVVLGSIITASIMRRRRR